MTTPLAGRVALVTGANHGIGAATVRRLAEAGHPGPVDVAETALGPVDIVVDNASGWTPDTFPTTAIPTATVRCRSRRRRSTRSWPWKPGRRG